MSTVSQSEAFQQAIKDSGKLTEKPPADKLLELYSLYKQGCGDDISKAATPGMFDLKGKAKKTAWQKVVDEGITAEQAQERYVKLVEDMKVTYKYDENKEPEAVGGGQPES